MDSRLINHNMLTMFEGIVATNNRTKSKGTKPLPKYKNMHRNNVFGWCIVRLHFIVLCNPLIWSMNMSIDKQWIIRLFKVGHKQSCTKHM